MKARHFLKIAIVALFLFVGFSLASAEILSGKNAEVEIDDAVFDHFTIKEAYVRYHMVPYYGRGNARYRPVYILEVIGKPVGKKDRYHLTAEFYQVSHDKKTTPVQTLVVDVVPLENGHALIQTETPWNYVHIFLAEK